MDRCAELDQYRVEMDVEISARWRLRLTILAALSLAAWMLCSYPMAESLIVIERIVARLANL